MRGKRKGGKCLKLYLVVKKPSHLLTTRQVPYLWVDETPLLRLKMMNSSSKSSMVAKIIPHSCIGKNKHAQYRLSNSFLHMSQSSPKLLVFQFILFEFVSF